jgi:hypothetical protein
MFDLNSLNELAGNVKVSSAPIEELTAEQCAICLVAESVVDMCRPIRTFSTNPRVAIQQQFNRTVALKIKDADSSTSSCLVELAQQAAMRIQSAQQAADDDAMNESVERLERIINLYVDLASNVARNSFYRHRECERMETAAADSHVDGMDGAKGAFETKSKYAGWKNLSVETLTMEDGAKQAVDGLLSIIKAVLPMASSYLKGFLSNDKGEVMVQLGYNRLPEKIGEEVEYERFYDLQSVWNNQAAQARDIVEPMSAADAAAAFNLPAAKAPAKQKAKVAAKAK